MGRDELWGLITIALSAAAVTLRVADPATDPEVAVITVLPLATPVARPFVPDKLLTVPDVGVDELHTD